jgi:hypothetical protein
MMRQSLRTRRGKRQTVVRLPVDAAVEAGAEAEEAVAVVVEAGGAAIAAVVGDEEGVSRREIRDGEEQNTHVKSANAQLDREAR